ncbi:uncharacterized protein LOC131144301 [Malania oleifera]|uniref:uncharacterized protein LOC131144301 n=1 Tax=Malania oleifera TaxID=397392 RepID=UPI0025AE7202|nr:uncharacterized protein LOC131144301 [Malania oleifera]
MDEYLGEWCQGAESKHATMVEQRNAPVLEGSQRMTDDEICTQVLGQRAGGWLNGIGNGYIAPTSSSSSSAASRAELDQARRVSKGGHRSPDVNDGNGETTAKRIDGYLESEDGCH